MKKINVSRVALAGTLLLGLAVAAAPSYAGSLNKKQPPKVAVSNRAIRVSGTTSKMNATRTIHAPLAKKAKSGK